ncbi:MAG: cupin domain-containing protein [Pseudomonadota bacterium]
MSEEPHQSEDIGQRVKLVRSAYGFSQRQLAKRSQVANATISQIESGKVNPTVGMLKKILDGIPITLSEFFTFDGKQAADKVFYRAHDLIEISEGGVSYRQIGGNLANKSIQLLREIYQPGAHTGRHELKHEGEECGIILKGALKVTVAGTSRILTAGEAYYFNSDQPHSFKNDGTEVCELISACSPPSF